MSATVPAPPARPVTATLALTLFLTLSLPAFAEKLRLERLPDQLGDKGLLVAQIGPEKWQDAEAELSDGTKHRLHRGFLVAALEPGRYTLSRVTRQAGIDYGLTTQTTRFSSLNLDREFEVVPGKVAHLGLTYLLEEPGKAAEGEGKQFIILSFENTGPEMRHLREFYPTLANTLEPGDVVTQPADYSNDKIQKIRELLYQLYAKEAARLAALGNEILGMGVSAPIEFTKSGLVVGDLGFLARKGSDGKLRLVVNDSLDRLSPLEFHAEDPWFHSREGDLYRIRDGAVVRVDSLPEDFYVTAGARLSETGILLSDRRFRFLVSGDGGTTWSRTDTLAASADQTLRVDFSAGDERVFAIGNDSSYFFKKPSAAIIDRASGEVREFDVPKKIKKGMRAVFETEAGLYVQTENAGSQPTTLYLRRHGTDKWVKNEVLNYFGCRVSFPDRTGKTISAFCGPNQNVPLISVDFGETWQRDVAKVSQTG